MFSSPIIRITNGFIDTVNDAVIGNIAGIGNLSKFAGQLGQGLWLDDYNILFSNPTVPVFGGRFRYVKLAAAATAVVRGQIVFWDYSQPDSAFQVTTAENGTTPNALNRAGIVLNPAWTAGNYSFIQDLGPTFVQFRAALTSASSGVGQAVYAAGAGAGADNGKADVLGQGTNPTFAQTGVLLDTFLGNAIQSPTNGSLSLVNLSWMNVRG